jgi:hypothetical protein
MGQTAKWTWKAIKDHLVEDAHKCWRWLSVQFAVLLVLLDLGLPYLPTLKEYLPAHVVSILAGAIVVARVYRQKSGSGTPPPKVE